MAEKKKYQIQVLRGSFTQGTGDARRTFAANRPGVPSTFESDTDLSAADPLKFKLLPRVESAEERRTRILREHEELQREIEADRQSKAPGISESPSKPDPSKPSQFGKQGK